MRFPVWKISKSAKKLIFGIIDGQVLNALTYFENVNHMFLVEIKSDQLKMLLHNVLISLHLEIFIET